MQIFNLSLSFSIANFPQVASMIQPTTGPPPLQAPPNAGQSALYTPSQYIQPEVWYILLLILQEMVSLLTLQLTEKDDVIT